MLLEAVVVRGPLAGIKRPILDHDGAVLDPRRKRPR